MELEDEQTVVLVKNGDRRAFAHLVEKYQRPIYNLAGQMVGFGEDACDLTQEIFLCMYRHLGSFRGECRFSTWVYRVASNRAIDWIRKKKRLTQGMDYRRPTPGVTPEEAYLEKERSQRLRDLLGVLPEKYRLVLVLHYYHGFTYEEIAESLEVSRRTVETRLYRGRVMLRERLLQEKTVENGGEGVGVSMAEQAVIKRPAAEGKP